MNWASKNLNRILHWNYEPERKERLVLASQNNYCSTSSDSAENNIWVDYIWAEIVNVVVSGVQQVQSLDQVPAARVTLFRREQIEIGMPNRILEIFINIPYCLIIILCWGNTVHIDYDINIEKECMDHH